jgi:uncharacterized membrane protein
VTDPVLASLPQRNAALYILLAVVLVVVLLGVIPGGYGHSHVAQFGYMPGGFVGLLLVVLVILLVMGRL